MIPDTQTKLKQVVFKDYHHIFALDDLELRWMDMVKHVIRLDHKTPFCKRYRRIPPHQYEEVKNHLKEMLEIGTIRKSQSPWASAVVLVCKKDGALRFCIDLHKLNVQMIKDAQTLPCIEESLDSLCGAVIIIIIIIYFSLIFKYSLFLSGTPENGKYSRLLSSWLVFYLTINNSFSSY